MTRYRIHLAYRGTNYHGWQIQQNALTVQQVLNEKMGLLLSHNIETIGCGRTDTGVHASSFYAHFDLPESISNTERLVFKLNQILPDDIVVYAMDAVSPDFHSRFDAISRTYEYHIIRTPDPFLTGLAWYQYGHLNMDAMNEASLLLLGEKDFQSFSKTHTQVAHYMCRVTHASWREAGHKWIFTVTANRFLRNMVRAMVGTLIEVGRDKLSVKDMIALLESRNRSEAGQSVPAHGLFLTQIIYP